MFGVNDLERINSSFLTFFEVLAENRKESNGNHGNWLSAFKHLKKFSKTNAKFSDINKQWLEDLKYYLVHDAETKNHKGLSQNSCVPYYNKVRAALREAINDGYIPRNPTDDIEGIKEVETKREFLTLDELQKAINAKCDIPVVKNAFIFSALTGLQFSDIQKLTWSKIQFSEENGYYI